MLSIIINSQGSNIIVQRICEFLAATNDWNSFKLVNKASVQKVSSDFGCYMLVCHVGNKKKTYIGKTNDIRRRLRQHAGFISGGAVSTKLLPKSLKDKQIYDNPETYAWRCVCLVTGFQNETQVLQFEHCCKAKASAFRTKHRSQKRTNLRQIDVCQSSLPRVNELLDVIDCDKWTKWAPPSQHIRLTIEWWIPEYRPEVTFVPESDTIREIDMPQGHQDQLLQPSNRELTTYINKKKKRKNSKHT